jgi:hypothetical protein
MNKPITMIIKELKKKLADACNESGLSPIILDMVVQEIHSEIHSLAERQALEEESAYIKMIDESAKKVDVAESNTDSKE